MAGPLSIAAMVAAAASFPTGFGFGAGYGAGVRVGYDIIYPEIAPFAREVSKGIIDAVRTVWRPGDAGSVPVADAARPDSVGRTDPRANRSVTSLTDVVGDVSDRPSAARSRQVPIASVAGERKFVSFSIAKIDSIGGKNSFSGELSESELHNLIQSYTQAMNSRNRSRRHVTLLRSSIAMLESIHRRVFHAR